MKKLSKRLMFDFRLILGNHPKLFFPIYSLKKYNRKLFIKKDTQLVVNAYPRCGNTFFYYAIKFLNPDLKISHHLHVPALTLEAIKKNKPLIVIIREPSKAIASLLIRENHLTFNQAFALYESFHEKVLDNESKILIFNFEEVVTDFKSIITKINNRFNLNLNNFKEFTEKEKINLFKKIEIIDKKTNAKKSMSENTVSRPSNDSQVQEMKEKFQSYAKTHPRYEICLKLFKNLYNNALKIK